MVLYVMNIIKKVIFSEIEIKIKKEIFVEEFFEK